MNVLTKGDMSSFQREYFIVDGLENPQMCPSIGQLLIIYTSTVEPPSKRTLWDQPFCPV